MKQIRTLRARFALWLTVLILAFLAAFGGFIYISLSRDLHAAVDDALALSAEQVLASLSEEDGSLDMPLPDPSALHLMEFVAFTQRGLTLRILYGDGEIVQAIGTYSQFEMPLPNSHTLPEYQTISDLESMAPIRVYAIPIQDLGHFVGWVQSLQSLSSAEEYLERLRTALLLGVALLTLLAGFAGYFLAGRALAPIDRITSTARRISTQDMSARLNLPDNGDEVSRLANTFDAMLARIESGFTRERQFTADASHELRTPLTVMQTILDFVREGERPAWEYRQALDDLAEETDRLKGLVEDLLQLARGERGIELNREEIDLALLLSDVADSLRPLADTKGLDLTCDLPSSLVISGDTDQLIRLIVNLLDNAIKYTEQGSIKLSARALDGHAVMEIADTGIGIPPEHLPHIFERFYTIDSSRNSHGTGLGLSIARQIARAHGGRIEVHSEVDRGTKFTIYLPRG